LAWREITKEMLVIEALQAIKTTNILIFSAFIIVILGSAILVGIDAAALRFGKNKEHQNAALRTGPVGWALGQILLWSIAYPWYLSSRHHATSKKIKNLSAAAIFFAIAFTVISVWLSVTIRNQILYIGEQLPDIPSLMDTALDIEAPNIGDISSSTTESRIETCKDLCTSRCEEMFASADEEYRETQISSCTQTCIGMCAR